MPHGDGRLEREELEREEASERRATRSALCDMETGRLRVSWVDVLTDDVLPDDLLAHDLSEETAEGRTDATEAIFAFAERDNPRRAFLFVSRVLGRHVPVRPSCMRRAFTRLADDIPGDLPGPVLMTGMAETAVGLGAGVHDAYLERTGRDDVVYLSSTRARFAFPLLADFSETHSHASAHRLYRPQHARERTLLEGARALVMVDDEASSGATFAHLAEALERAGLDALIHVHTAVLTDWSDGRDAPGPGGTGAGTTGGTAAGEAVTRSRSALTRGRHEWTPRANAPRRTLPDADTPREPTVDPLPRADDGRLGRASRSARGCPPALAASLDPRCGPVLVLGAGEHVWEPFLVAESLERDGRDVRFGATTRSPILPGHAIRRGYAFGDHEGLGITNYLYNVDPDAFERIVLCVDTALEAIDPALLAALGADVLVGERFHPRETLADRLAGAPPVRTFVAPGGWTSAA